MSDDPGSGVWLTVSAAAARAGISRQAVLKAIENGVLKAQRGTIHSRLGPWLVEADSLDNRHAAPSNALTTRQAAVILRRSERAVRGYIERGLLTAVERHGQLWIDEAEVRAFQVPKLGRPFLSTTTINHP